MPRDKTSSKAGKVFDVDTVRIILSQVRPYRRRFIWTGVLVVLLSSLVWIRPALIRQAVDVHIAAGDLEGLLRVFLMVVAVLVVEALVQYRVTYLANWVAQSVSLDLRAKLYRHVSRFRLQYFDQTPVGTLVTRHVSDIDGVANVFSNGILNAVGDLLALFVVIGAMLFIDWSLTLVVLIPIPVLLLATRIFQKHIKAALLTCGTKWHASMNLSRNTSPACTSCRPSTAKRKRPMPSPRSTGPTVRRTSGQFGRSACSSPWWKCSAQQVSHCSCGWVSDMWWRGGFRWEGCFRSSSTWS